MWKISLVRNQTALQQKAAIGRLRIHQIRDLFPKRRVAGASRIEVCRTIVAIELESSEKNRLYLLPVFGGHAASSGRPSGHGEDEDLDEDEDED
jgi:hypothetical protein